MRYYRIVVSDPSGKLPDRIWSSINSDGSYNPNAQNIELDMPLSTMATPKSAAFLRIWGISIQDISQANNLNKFNISIYAGMSKGLPLANAVQSGLILSGTIFQAFGNWIGTNQTLDMQIIVPVGKKNITINWKKGTELIPALTQTLQNAFGSNYLLDTSNITEKTGFILTEDQIGYVANVAQLATWVKSVSQKIRQINPDNSEYSGLDIILQQNKLILIDNSGIDKKTPKKIEFTDLIGQPTWVGLLQIQFNCVMRADLSLGDFIQMPKTIATNLPSGFSQYRQNSIFQGVFQILGSSSSIRHVGNFRDASGTSWITVINAVQMSVIKLASGGNLNNFPTVPTIGNTA